MVKALFVCLGNICRSPMAEFVLKDMVAKKGLENQFYISSSATSYEAIGEDMHNGTKRKLDEKGIHWYSGEKISYKGEDFEICIEYLKPKTIKIMLEESKKKIMINMIILLGWKKAI